MQTWLELAGCRDVTIPFAHELAALADPRAVRLRRDFGALLALIRAHAILHQATRARDAHGRIIATLADYAAVFALVIDTLSEGVQATVSPAIRETVAAVAALEQETGLPVAVTSWPSAWDLTRAPPAGAERSDQRRLSCQRRRQARPAGQVADRRAVAGRAPDPADAGRPGRTTWQASLRIDIATVPGLAAEGAREVSELCE